MPKPLPVTSDQPAQLPEIPKLPQVSEAGDLPGAGPQTSSGTTAEAAHPAPRAGNDSQQNQAVTPVPTGLAFPEQAKLHEALRQPPPSGTAMPVSAPSDAAAPVPGTAKLDEAAAAAQADLASPLPTLVPNDQPSVPGANNQDRATVSDPAASANVPLLTETQSQPKSEPTVGDRLGGAPTSSSLDPAVDPLADASPSPSAAAIAATQDPSIAQPMAEAPRDSKPASSLADPKAKASPSADKAVEAAALPAVTALSEPSLTPPAPINLETPADASTKPAPAPAPTPAPAAAPPTPDPTPTPEQRSSDPDSIPLPPLGNESEQPQRGHEGQQLSSAKTSEPSQTTAPAPPESASPAVPAVAAATEELPALPRSGNRVSDQATQAEPLPPPADDLPALPPNGPALPAPARDQRPCSRPRQLRRPRSPKLSRRHGRLLTRQFRRPPPIRPRSLQRHGQRKLPSSSRRVNPRRLWLVPRKLPVRESLPQPALRLWNQGNHLPRPHHRFRPRKRQTQRPSPQARSSVNRPPRRIRTSR